ncbi:MAG: MFS transporter [Clostridia bacterium]|nr:MFS transporter [Clostridia bacterium]
MDSKIGQRNLILAVIGRIISDLGSSLFRFGLSLYILDLTGSAAAFSSFLIFSILPGLFVNVFAGAIIDRANKKKILVISDIASGVAVLIFMVIFRADPGDMGLFLVYAIVLGLIQSFFGLSLNSSIPELVPAEDVNKANSAFQSVGALISIIGPVIGAVVYATLGLANIFIIDGISFIIAGILENMLVYRREKVQAAEGTKTNLLEDVKEVFRYLGDKKGMIIMMLVSVSANLFFVPMFTLVLPYVCYQIIGVSEIQLSITQGSWAVGMIVGALMVGRMKDNRPIMSHTFKLLFLTGLLFIVWLLPAVPAFVALGNWAVIIVLTINLIVGAIINSYINIPVMSFIQVTVPEALRGRFFGVLMTASMLSSPVGLWLYGLMLENVYWIWTPILTIVAISACALISDRNRHLKEMIKEYQNSELPSPQPAVASDAPTVMMPDTESV